MALTHREKWIWLLARNWVTQDSYSVIHTEQGNDGNTTLHLIKNVNGQWHYIRIASVDYMWPQWVERDIAESTQAMLKRKSQLNYQLVQALYLYVFRNSPPPEVKDRIIEHQSPQSKQMQSYFGWIDLEQGTYRTDRELLPFQLEPLVESMKVDDVALPEIQEMQLEINKKEELREKRRKAWFGQSKPTWTYIFLGINTALFLLLSFYGSREAGIGFMEGSTNIDTLIQFGAKSTYHIIEGEWWRFITPIFLHIGIMHFVFNSIALLSLGTLVEGIYGSKRFVPIYLLSGIVGNVASFLFSEGTGAGASGAIFGAMGAMIYFVLNSKTEWTKAIGRDVVLILGINIVIGFMQPAIDNYAHFGGLLGGFLVAAATGLPQKKSKWWAGTGAAALLIVLLTGGISYGMAYGKESIGYLNYEAQLAIKNQQYGELEDIFEKMAALKPNDPQISFKLGIAYLQNEKVEESKKALLKATELDPDHANAYYYLGVIEHSEGNNEEAKRFLQEVIRIDPEHTEAKQLLGNID